MKVSDIMLDLETGDASVHDAYVQEAMGQVNVSAAIYDAAKNIASLEPSEMTEVIQEAATNAGLPTDREKAIELMYEAVERELIATSRHLYQEACIFVEFAEKETSPNKALNAIARKCGAKSKLNPSLEYATEFATTVTGGANKTVKLDGKRFFTAESAKNAAATVIQAFVNAAEATCNTIPKSFLKNESVIAINPAIASATDGDTKKSLAHLAGNINNAKKTLSGAEKLKKTANPGANDIATCMCAWFAVYAVSKGLQSNHGGAKSEKQISAAVKECNKKKVSGAAEDCNKNCPDVNKKLHEACSGRLAAFGDAFEALLSAVGSEK